MSSGDWATIRGTTLATKELGRVGKEAGLDTIVVMSQGMVREMLCWDLDGRQLASDISIRDIDPCFLRLDMLTIL